MSANVQIDAEMKVHIHIGPKVVCNRAQDVNSEINVLCCKISLKVYNKLIDGLKKKMIVFKEPDCFVHCIYDRSTNTKLLLQIYKL